MAANISTNGTITTNTPGPGNTVSQNSSTYSIAGLQVIGTWTGTITFEATVDGIDWVSLAATPIAGGAAVTNTTANGVWRANLSGLYAVRARGSAAMTGTSTVYISASQYGSGGV